MIFMGLKIGRSSGEEMADREVEDLAMLKGKRSAPGSVSSLLSLGCPSPSSLLSSSSSSISYEIEGEVGRDVLAQICFSALSRILDFPDDKFEVLISSEEGDSRESQSSIAKNIRSTLKNAKVSLKSHTYQKWDRLSVDEIDGCHSNAGIKGISGYVIMRVIPHLETMVTTEGLFRVPGSKLRVTRLAEELTDSDWTSILNDSSYKPHDFASVLKQYLINLPESLLPGNHLEAYLQVAGLEAESTKLKCIQLLTLLLHPTHRLVFQNLLELLWSVAQHEEENKMSSHSLALMFAPNLIWTSSQSTLSGAELDRFSSVLHYMIQNCYEVFEVPTDVQIPAEQHLRKKSSGDVDSSLYMVNTYCQQTSSEDFHSSGQRLAMEEMAKLYSHVQTMPDGHQKTQFLKKYESGRSIPCSPQPHVRKSSKLWKMLTPSRNKAKKVDYSDTELQTPTPRKPCFRKGSLKLKSYSQMEEMTVSSPLAERNLSYSCKRPVVAVKMADKENIGSFCLDVGEELPTPQALRTCQITEI